MYAYECYQLLEVCGCIISVLASSHAPVAQEFLKRGCPWSLRGSVWAQVMGSYIQPQHVEYFSILKERVLQYDLMVDKLILKVRRKVKVLHEIYFTRLSEHLFFSITHNTILRRFPV
jgi:hypothetical protein